MLSLTLAAEVRSFLSPGLDVYSSAAHADKETQHVDGILNKEFGHFLAQGKGTCHGVDSSPAMIKCSAFPTRAAVERSMTSRIYPRTLRSLLASILPHIVEADRAQIREVA